MPTAVLTPPVIDRFARARRATRVQFALLGLAGGAWGAHVPSVKARHALGDGMLSMVLLAAGIGAVLSLLFAGPLVGRLGVRRAAALAAVAMGLALAGVLQAPTFAAVLPLMVVFGAAGSLFDVAINAEGTMLEHRSGRAVMSGLHGMFSLGGMAGAALAAAMLRAGVPAALQLAAVGVAVAAGAVLATRGMLPASAHHDSGDADATPAHFAWPRGTLLLLGGLVFAGMTAEGVMYDWSVLYLKDEVGLPQAQAAVGYAVFSAAMAAMRFGGDALRMRLPERTILSAGATLAALAMAAVLAAAQPAVAFIGYALAGIGLAPAVPILYNAATRVPGVSRAAAIASVSSIGYGGFMLGPPLIGALAQARSLTAALGVVVVAAALLALGARRVPAKA